MKFEFKIKEGHRLISDPAEIKGKPFDLACPSSDSVLVAFADGTFCFQNPDWYTEKYATELTNDWMTRQVLMSIGLIDSDEWNRSVVHESTERAKQSIEDLKKKHPELF